MKQKADRETLAVANEADDHAAAMAVSPLAPRPAAQPTVLEDGARPPTSVEVEPVEITADDEPLATGISNESGPVSPGSMVGEYRVEGELGRGGMSTVYAAVHPLIGKKAAVKVINPALCADPSLVHRFVQEARSVNQIGHPNIVDIFSFGELPDGRSYYVMEMLEGETLWQRLQREPLAVIRSLEILDQVADALEAVHDKGIVHRDLKPANIFLADVPGNRTMVKLLDFGIAKLSNADGQPLSSTRSGMLLGTPGYLSPEQARGKNVTFSTDIYALGVVAFEMVTGRAPFLADTAIDLMMQHVHNPPPTPRSILPGLPPALDTLILRMLDKDAGARPALHEVRSTLAVVHAKLLEQGESSVPGRALLMPGFRTPAPSSPGATLSTVSTTPPPRRARRSWPLQIGFAALGLILAAAAGFAIASFSRNSGTQDETIVIAAPASPTGTAAPVTIKTSDGATNRLETVAAASAGATSGEASIEGAAGAASTAPTTPAAAAPTGAASADAASADAASAGAASAGAPPAGPASTAAAAKPGVRYATVTVNAKPWVEVWIDGKRVAAETPLRGRRVTAGRHVLRFVNGAAGYRAEQSVSFDPGESKEIFVDVPAKSVRVR